MFRFWEQPNLEETGGIGTGGGALPVEKEKKGDKFSGENGNVAEQREQEEARRMKIATMIAEPKMRDRYKDRANFEREMEETRRRFGAFLEESFEKRNPELFRNLRDLLEGESSGKVVELLTLIRLSGDSYKPELHHEELFRHSLGVFRMIAEAYEDVLMMNGGGASASFRLDGSIAEEMGKRKDSERDCEDARLEMLLAALVHDVGKITLPEEIVYNSITNEESIAIVRDALVGSSDISLSMAQILNRCQGRWQDFPVLPKDFLKEERADEQKDESWRFVRDGNDVRVFLSRELRNSLISWLPKEEQKENSEEKEGEEKKREIRINPLMSVAVLLEAELKPELEKDADRKIASGVLEEEGREAFVREETLKRVERLKELRPPIDPNAPLEEILRLHEERSGTLVRILEDAAIREWLVSHHHNYNHELFYIFSSGQAGDAHLQMMKFFQTHDIPSDINESLASTVANRLMALCDVFEALGGDRSYKKPMSFGKILVFFVDLARRERAQYERHVEKQEKDKEPVQEQQEEHERQGLGIITRFIEHKIRMRERDSGVRWEEDTTIDEASKRAVDDFLEEERKRVSVLLKPKGER